MASWVAWVVAAKPKMPEKRPSWSIKNSKSHTESSTKAYVEVPMTVSNVGTCKKVLQILKNESSSLAQQSTKKIISRLFNLFFKNKHRQKHVIPFLNNESNIFHDFI